MKIIKIPILATIAFVLLFLYSCKKDNGISYDNQAQGRLKDSIGNCLPMHIEGTYWADSVLKYGNFIDVHVYVDSVGKFAIGTDTLNGFSFFGKGTFGYKGDNLVRLYGYGKPLSGGTNIFTVKFGTSSCAIAIKVSGTVIPPASYTVDTTAGNCMGATVDGTFSTNIPTTALNKVTLTVNVKTAGTYSLTSNNVNGITFSGKNVFTGTGEQTVVLTASGTPASVGSFNYTVSSGTSCVFSVSAVQGPTAAVFSLGGAPSTCTGFNAYGTYTAGTALSNSNTVSCQANVTTAGAYSITTNTVNGISFSASGIFTATGPQTITLTGTGTPTSAGTNNFTATAGTSTCTFSITTVTSGGGPSAVFTLGGAPGSCSGFTSNGTYTAGTALTTGNTVSCQVNVTTVGTYTISTNTVNGISFSKTSTFTGTGTQTVTLTGTGTPTTAGANNYTVTGGGSTCTFSITAGTATVPTGTYSCKVDGVLINFTDRAVASVKDDLTGAPRLYLDGFIGPPNGNFVPELQIFIDKNDASAITPGSYNEKGYLSVTGYRIEIDYHAQNPDLSVTIWNTSSNLLSTNPPFTITVSSITATRVKGTFSGKLTNTLQGSTTTKTVTEGVFDLPIQ